jgi:hypothetical protein
MPGNTIESGTRNNLTAKQAASSKAYPFNCDEFLWISLNIQQPEMYDNP